MFGDLSCVQPQISVSIWFGTAIHLLSFISSCTNIPWLPNRFFVVEDNFFLSSRSFLAATIACARGWSSVGTCRGIAAYLVSISKKQRHSFPGTCLKGHKNKEKKHICTYRITQTFLCEFFFFLFLMADAFSHFYATLREAEPAANCSTNQVMMVNFVQRTDSRRDECLRLGHHWVMLCEC